MPVWHEQPGCLHAAEPGMTPSLNVVDRQIVKLTKAREDP